MSPESILLIVAVVVAAWQSINLVITLAILPTKQLVGSDKILAAYFASTFLASIVIIVLLGLNIAKSSGLLP